MLFQCKLGGDLYPGALFPDVFVCLQQDPWPPLPPPRLVYRDRPITGEAYKNVSVCVLGVRGAYKRKFMVFETVKHSQFKEQRTET